MEIRSEAALRELLGMPHARAAGKDRARLAEMDRRWLAASPFCVLATSDAAGRCDASPKGDPAGQLIHVLDEATVAVRPAGHVRCRLEARRDRVPQPGR
jgi:predicted pyridoxine 5'-phosphate oxidase superfamily flavin-nucleotide-binding protein